MPDPDAPVVEKHHHADFQPPAAIVYTVQFPVSDPHHVVVEAQFPIPAGASELELFLPVWTPGSYLIREYSRHIDQVTVTAPFDIMKTRKNRWLVRIPEPASSLVVRYRIYCHDLTVRTNYRDESLAILIGAATFLGLAGDSPRPCEVILQLPPSWAGSWSGMLGERDHFYAADYDHLVDSPIVAGNPSSASFEIDGKPHVFLCFGETRYWDLPQALKDTGKIVQEHRQMWRGLPYQRYVFFNLITGSRGALEHRDSMLLMADRLTMRSRNSYRSWLEVASHEFFHLWNVKRLRPAELGPFDYENEVYTRNLWIAEGFTEYYGPLAVCRAGLTTPEELLGTQAPPPGAGVPDSISGWIETVQSAPGRLEQSVSEASFDAWIKFYRPDENSRNSTISYYTKGALIAWLLDAKTRAATSDARSLDDIMRLAFSRHAGDQGFSTLEFLMAAEEVSGTTLKEWFARATESTDELDYSEALAWFGLRFKEPGPRKPWLGVSTKIEDGRLVISQVLRGSSAEQAGISASDEILAIDDYRVKPNQWPAILEQFRPGEQIQLLLSHRDRIKLVTLDLEEEPARRWTLEEDPEATETQHRRLNCWLHRG